MNNLKMKNYRAMLLMTMIVFLLLSLIFAFTSPAFAEKATANAYEAKIYSNAKISDDFADDSIIVIMDKNSSEVNKSHNLSVARNTQTKITDLTHIDGSVDRKKYFNKDEFHQILKIELSEHSKENVLQEIHKYENMEGVLWVGPNYYDEPMELPIASNGTRYPELWGLLDSGIQAQQAWSMTNGSKDVRVGVIDTGVANHSDLNENLVTGWDFYNNNAITNDDTSSHGTHVAGTIGASGNLLNGVVGVSPKVSIVPLQVADTNNQWPLDAVTRAITWAINNDIDIINYSGGGATDNEARRVAIGNYSGLFVCAAGNTSYYGNNNDTSRHYPSDYSRGQDFSGRVISVGNIDVNGNRYTSSHYGTKSVSIYAPGTNILSTVPLSYNSTGYATKTGTSMAAPHVSGAAALLLSYNPNLSAEQLKTIMLESADTITIDKGKVKKLNLFKAMKNLSQGDYDLLQTTDLDNDEIQIDGLKKNYQGKLEIPEYINGRKVTEIKGEAFQGQKGITEVILPSTLTSIGNAAFMNCWQLESISFGANPSLKYINGYAFQQCIRLKSVTIPSSVTNVSYGIMAFAEQATIYTNATSIPTNWDHYWNKAGWISIERPVVWGCTLSSDKSYVVSFTKNINSITKSNAINGISAPSRCGYSFCGWYDNINYTGTPIAAENLASAPNGKTYYAKWVKNNTITFDHDNDYGIKEQIVLDNESKVIKPESPSNKSGYVFKYWALSTNLNQEYNWNNIIAEDTVIKAVWQAIGSNKVVTFDLNGGEASFSPQQIVSNGATVSRPATPKKVGYTFSHWVLSGQSTSYNFSTPVTSNITLVAVWAPTTTYTVKFDTNGGYESYPSVKVNSWDYVKKPDIDPVQDGCIFKYWALSSNLTQEYNWNTAVSNDITLMAVWEDLHCYVSFDGVDLNTFPLFSLALLKGDNVQDFFDFNEIQNPTKEGYTFRFWALSTNKTSAYNLSATVTQSIRLEAIWDINKYTVTFNTNGGSGSYPSKTIEYGSKVSKPSDPTRSGYIFKHWALSGQTTAYDFNTPVTSNISLVAIWEEEPKCVAEGTLITLADGSQKAVEQLTGDEMLLVWNFNTGNFDAAPILFIDKDPYVTNTVINLTFSDGTSIKVISEHAFWNYNLNSYVYLDENAAQYIGHWFNKQAVNDDGNMVTVKVQLTDVLIQEEQTATYSPITYGYMCYYVNGMLSMPGGIEGLFNIFEVDSETMKYNAIAMESDIAAYGLYAYEEFAELVPVTEEMFNAVQGQYLKIAIGKGLITIEDIEELVDRYSIFFEQS